MRISSVCVWGRSRSWFLSASNSEMFCLTSAAREKSWLRTVSSRISFNSFSFTRMFAICDSNNSKILSFNYIHFRVVFFKICILYVLRQLCFFSEIVKFLTLMSFCLRSSSEGPVSTVVIGSLISDTISARTGTRLEEWDLILHRGSIMYFTRLWLTWSMISISWRRLSTALLKVQSAKHLNVKSKGKLYCNLLNNTCR